MFKYGDDVTIDHSLTWADLLGDDVGSDEVAVSAGDSGLVIRVTGYTPNDLVEVAWREAGLEFYVYQHEVKLVSRE